MNGVNGWGKNNLFNKNSNLVMRLQDKGNSIYIYIYIYIYNSLFDHAKFFLFIFHILAISISRSLYLLGFSNSIAEILLSDSTLISIN